MLPYFYPEAPQQNQDSITQMQMLSGVLSKLDGNFAPAFGESVSPSVLGMLQILRGR